MEKLVADHAAIVIVLISLLWTGLVGCLLYIFAGMKKDVADVKDLLTRLTGEIFQRLKDVENSLSLLWGEHKGHLDAGGCYATDRVLNRAIKNKDEKSKIDVSGDGVME